MGSAFQFSSHASYFLKKILWNFCRLNSSFFFPLRVLSFYLQKKELKRGRNHTMTNISTPIQQANQHIRNNISVQSLTQTPEIGLCEGVDAFAKFCQVIYIVHVWKDKKIFYSIFFKTLLNEIFSFWMAFLWHEIYERKPVNVLQFPLTIVQLMLRLCFLEKDLQQTNKMKIMLNHHNHAMNYHLFRLQSRKNTRFNANYYYFVIYTC